MPSRILQIFLTLYLAVFLTGGGRVCACEALSWFGIDVHAREHQHRHHGHDHDAAGADEDESPLPKCCETSLHPIEANLPEGFILSALSFPDVPDAPDYSPWAGLDAQIMPPGVRAAVRKHPPPHLAHGELLSFLQRYLI